MGTTGLGRKITADDTDLERQDNAPYEVASFVFGPLGERCVGLTTAGVGVRRRFNGAPVIARGNGDSINAVHDAFVVGGGAVRIDTRKVVGQK